VEFVTGDKEGRMIDGPFARIFCVSSEVHLGLSL
jgi:hypothetical protein